MEKETKEWGNKEQRTMLHILRVMFPEVRNEFSLNGFQSGFPLPRDSCNFCLFYNGWGRLPVAELLREVFILSLMNYNTCFISVYITLFFR